MSENFNKKTDRQQKKVFNQSLTINKTNNMKNNTTTTLDIIKEQIVDRLQDYNGGVYYGCDLAYKLFEGENANGSVFCNTYKTVEFIKDNFDLFGELVEHWNNATGETLNPFSEPEKCHVIFLLEAANSILSSCSYISDNWNERIELTEGVIATITEQVNEFDGDLF